MGKLIVIEKGMKASRTGLAWKAIGLALSATVFSAGMANADSIDPITSGSSNTNSVVTIGCATCPALKSRAKSSDYVVQTLEPGTQRIETREINGVMKIVRTEAWMGGSPIVFISKVPGMENTATASGEMVPPTDEMAISADDTPPPVDKLTTTSAVTATMDGAPSGLKKMNSAQNKLLDSESFKLRSK